MTIEDVLTLAKAGYTAQQINSMIQPTQQVQQTQPTPSPIQQTTTAQPIQQTAPVQPIQTIQPIQPVQPIQPIQPVQPIQPFHQYSAVQGGAIQTPPAYGQQGNEVPPTEIPNTANSFQFSGQNNGGNIEYMANLVSQVQAQNRALASGAGMQTPAQETVQDITQAIINHGYNNEKGEK